MSTALPPFGYPLLTRMISNRLFPPDAGQPDEPMTWALTHPHPLVPGMRVVRMFVSDGGVEVYSHDNEKGMRNLIPMHSIRLTEEAMPLEVLIDEILAAESPDEDGGDDEEDDDDGDQRHEPAVSVVAPPNGQPVT